MMIEMIETFITVESEGRLGFDPWFRAVKCQSAGTRNRKSWGETSRSHMKEYTHMHRHFTPASLCHELMASFPNPNLLKIRSDGFISSIHPCVKARADVMEISNANPRWRHATASWACL
jgi:hypothetical protein